jgi:hypothetical protein
MGKSSLHTFLWLIANVHSIAQIIELAKQMEAEDPIDWSDLPLLRELTYEMLAGSVLETALAMPPGPDRETLLMVTAVKLIVENYVLYTRQILNK